jgi:hypothetical protein
MLAVALGLLRREKVKKTKNEHRVESFTLAIRSLLSSTLEIRTLRCPMMTSRVQFHHFENVVFVVGIRCKAFVPGPPHHFHEIGSVSGKNVRIKKGETRRHKSNSPRFRHASRVGLLPEKESVGYSNHASQYYCVRCWTIRSKR